MGKKDKQKARREGHALHITASQRICRVHRCTRTISVAQTKFDVLEAAGGRDPDLAHKLEAATGLPIRKLAKLTDEWPDLPPLKSKLERDIDTLRASLRARVTP